MRGQTIERRPMKVGSPRRTVWVLVVRLRRWRRRKTDWAALLAAVEQGAWR